MWLGPLWSGSMCSLVSSFWRSRRLPVFNTSDVFFVEYISFSTGAATWCLRLTIALPSIRRDPFDPLWLLSLSPVAPSYRMTFRVTWPRDSSWPERGFGGGVNGGGVVFLLRRLFRGRPRRSCTVMRASDFGNSASVSVGNQIMDSMWPGRKTRGTCLWRERVYPFN